MMKTNNIQREGRGISGIRIDKGKGNVIDRVFGYLSAFHDDGGYRRRDVLKDGWMLSLCVFFLISFQFSFLQVLRT